MKFSTLVYISSLIAAPFVAASPVDRSTGHGIAKRQVVGLADVCLTVNALCPLNAGVPGDCTACTACIQADVLSCVQVGVQTFDFTSCTCNFAAQPTRRRRRDDIYIDANGQVAIGDKKPFLPNQICPGKLTGCKVPGQSKAPGLTLFQGDKYECLDLDSHIESCGGCVSEGQGQDCTAIANAVDVECQVGACLVLSCEAGFTPSANGLSCEVDLKKRSKSIYE